MMNYDLFMGGRCICLLKGTSGPRSSRCSGGGEKLHERGRDEFDNCNKK